MRKWKASVSPGRPKDGHHKVVLSVRAGLKTRWEFDGQLPKDAVHRMMNLAVTNGKTDCVKAGEDEAIAAFFPALSGQPERETP